MEKTKVIFRVFTDGVAIGDVIALFPEIPYTHHSNDCECYQHIGQHGRANYRNLLSVTRMATVEEYRPLYRELQGIGYDLQVCRRQSQKMQKTCWFSSL